MGLKLNSIPTFDHPLGFRVREHGPNVHTVLIDADTAPNWERWFLLSSDRHHDNAKTDWRLERDHLDEARKRRAGLIDAGDLFCAMQGKWDPRADMTQCRDEHKVANYLDALTRTAHEFYEPFADLWLMLGLGNHETSIMKRHQTNLTQALVEKLREKNPAIRMGGYGGWLVFTFTFRKTQICTVRLKYFHGSGGGGPVTRGVIQTNRMAVYLPDADIVHTGHTHDEWMVPISRERITKDGVIFKDRQIHVRTAGYKDEYADGSGGWHIERGGAPKPQSAAWLRFYWSARAQRIVPEIREAI